MKINTDAIKQLLLIASLSLTSAASAASTPPTFVDNLAHGKFVFQLGAFSAANQGKSQQITIQTLIGDYFSVAHSQNQNALAGIGYFVDGLRSNRWDLQYGLNAFYFFETTVSGTVTQEQLFTNLGYSYSISNLPVYATAKGLFHFNNPRYHLTLDLGLGPNIKQTSNFTENSLDGGVTIPDQPFNGKTNVIFSAMTGIGVKIDHALDQSPLECGYHIFYLGRGQFSTTSNQIVNSLKTGNSYAQALSCGISL
jgi:hypothetical protein